MTRKIHPCSPHNSSLEEWQNQECAAIGKWRLGQKPPYARPFAVNEPACGFFEKQVKKAWHGLNQDQRELLELYIAEGLTCRQIAERKQQSHAAVRQALVQLYAQLLLQVDSGPYDSQLERY